MNVCFILYLLFSILLSFITPSLMSSTLPFISCPSAYKWIHGELRGNIPLQYLAWVSYPLMFILFSSLFCHLVAPQAIGLYPLLHPQISSHLHAHTTFWFCLFNLDLQGVLVNVLVLVAIMKNTTIRILCLHGKRTFSNFSSLHKVNPASIFQLFRVCHSRIYAYPKTC